jgi:hypothetical protein
VVSGRELVEPCALDVTLYLIAAVSAPPSLKVPPLVQCDVLVSCKLVVGCCTVRSSPALSPVDVETFFLPGARGLVRALMPVNTRPANPAIALCGANSFGR